MSDKKHNPRTRLTHKLNLSVTADEMDLIDRKRKELGIQSRTDFLRAAIETLVGEKFFRERIYEKQET